MMHKKRHHTASYDDEGNIVIPADDLREEEASSVSSERSSRARRQHQERAISWVVTDVDGSEMPSPLPTRMHRDALRTVMEEGLRQYKETMEDVEQEAKSLRQGLSHLPDTLHGKIIKAWRVATMPCFTGRVRYGQRAKPKSRVTLFFMDTVRFGVTFAVIFGVLFLGINFQSFWNIAKAELALNEDIHTVEALQKLTDGPSPVFNENDSGSLPSITPPIASRSPSIERDGILLAALPPVGPPDNRLIIPKIGKNVPIVIPPIDSLLDENWKEFENDIQESLRYGVVHYPGTARPGQAGNFFITGHSSYYPWDKGQYKDVFALLHELEVGDTYSVYYGGDLHTYRVTRSYEVKPTNVSVLDQPTDKRIATLMTCTPIGTTLRRLIVQAEEIDPLTGRAMKTGDRGSRSLPQPSVNVLPI